MWEWMDVHDFMDVWLDVDMGRVGVHSALEQLYCLQKMHFWRPTLVCNTCLGEHFDQFLAKSTGRLWINLYITCYSGKIPKYS